MNSDDLDIEQKTGIFRLLNNLYEGTTDEHDYNFMVFLLETQFGMAPDEIGLQERLAEQYTEFHWDEDSAKWYD